MKRKIRSTVRVADAAGGMAPLPDLRFDAIAWPIHFEVPADIADHWIDHLSAECSERGWQTSALGQLEADQNSGTIIVSTGPHGTPALEIVWERPRGGPIDVKGRPAGTPPLALDAANSFLDAAGNRCRQGTKVRLHRRAHLIYKHRPWRGELWLENDLRLGPPSKYVSWINAPQVIIVDAMVEGIGGVNSEFDLIVRELSIFLTVLIGINVTKERSGWVWTYTTDATLKVTECDLRHLGYEELTARSGMPQPGEAPDILLRPVQRPGLERSDISEDVEQAVPEDVVDLWRMFRDLPAERRDQFLRAGNAYQIALSMWPDQGTACAAFMVVACESLKPSGKRHDERNIYDVVEGLLGASEVKQLRQLRRDPQRVRSRHLHRGELAAGELVPILRWGDFGDPSFDETISKLTRTTRTCLIEWLRKGGQYELKRPPVRARRPKR